jgi:hypothetical protein
MLGIFTEVLAFQDAGLQLGTPTFTNGQVQFTLTGESDVRYVIEHSADFVTWAPLITNSESSITRMITTDAPSDAGFFRASRGRLPLFAAALVAVGTIDLRGNNITTDSFDSGDPNYSENGLYPWANLIKTKAGGDVCTGTVLMDSMAIGSARIKGEVRTGLGTNTINIGANGGVGDRAWVEGGNVGIQPGHSTTDFNVRFPDVVLPAGLVTPATKPSSNQTLNGTNYTYVFTSSGDWRIPNFGNNDNI